MMHAKKTVLLLLNKKKRVYDVTPSLTWFPSEHWLAIFGIQYLEVTVATSKCKKVLLKCLHRSQP